MLCPNCKELTLVGTQHQCVRSNVIIYSCASETQGETISRVRGDHEGEHHSLERGLSRRYQTKESPSSNSSSTGSSSVNSFKPSYIKNKGSCHKCKQWVQLPLYGTQQRCLCGYVMTYGAAAETQGETSSYVRGDHKGEDRDADVFPSSRLEEPVPSGSRPNRRALLCGLTYKHLKYNLKGIHNDVMNMEDLLIKTLGFPANCIRILSEDDPLDLERIPTKKNIENSLKWLVEDCQRGDSLVFYFSGHGLRQSDFKDDELDGFDETICPVDFMKEGIVLDNDINETIVRPLKEGVTLLAIVDASNINGTILDLEYVYNHKLNAWKENIPPSGVRKSTNGGLAISLSTCEDNTTMKAFTGRAMQGAMTYILTHHNYGRFSHKNTEKLKV
ncbi:hypothetical protein ACFX2C_002777 [Malus domestica]